MKNENIQKGMYCFVCSVCCMCRVVRRYSVNVFQLGTPLVLPSFWLTRRESFGQFVRE